MRRGWRWRSPSITTATIHLMTSAPLCIFRRQHSIVICRTRDSASRQASRHLSSKPDKRPKSQAPSTLLRNVLFLRLFRLNPNVGVTKAELIEEVSKVVEVTRKDSEGIVEAIFGGIVGSLHRGEKIEIRGFGSFRTRQRQPRVGRNPKTGTRVEVPSKRIPYFKPSKELKDLVNTSAGEPGATPPSPGVEPPATQ